MNSPDKSSRLVEQRTSHGMIAQKTSNALRSVTTAPLLSTEMKLEETVSPQATPSSTMSTVGDLVPIHGNLEMFTSVTTTPTTSTRSLMERERSSGLAVQNRTTATHRSVSLPPPYPPSAFTSLTQKQEGSQPNTKSGSTEMDKLQAEADRISNELLVLSGHVRALVSQLRLWQVRNGIQ